MRNWVTNYTRVTHHATPCTMAKQLAVTEFQMQNLSTEKRAIIWFGQGFGVRVSPDGRKDFVYFYWAPGRTTKRLLTLGQYGQRQRDGMLPPGTISLKDAIDRHGAAKRLLIDDGIDPFVHEQQQAAQFESETLARVEEAEKQAQALAEDSLQAVFDRYVLVELKFQPTNDGGYTGRKDSGKEFREYFERHVFRNPGNPNQQHKQRKLDRHMPIRDVRKGHITAIIDDVRANGTPRAASVLYSMLRQFFDWAVDREKLDISPMATLKKKRTVGPAPRPVERTLEDWELVRLFDRLPSLGLDPISVLALQFEIATGQRGGEVCGMPKAELNDDRTVWSIPRSRYKTGNKTGKGHVVPLSTYARTLLAEADKYNQGSAFVFASPTRGDWKRGRRPKPGEYLHPDEEAMRRRPDAPVERKSVSKAISRKLGTPVPEGATAAAGKLGLKSFSPHDFRRVCRSGLAALGVAEHVAERVIGHVESGMQAVYNRHDYKHERAAALELWGEKLASLAKRAMPAAPRADRDKKHK